MRHSIFIIWRIWNGSEQQCAEIISFSPLHDKKVPENVDGLILGGGFPEVFAEKISANKSMLSSIKKTVESGIPTVMQNVED